MGKRGPAPLPTKTKHAQGTLEKSRVLSNEVEYNSLEAIPLPPEDWPEYAKEVWIVSASNLYENGLLYETDLPQLQEYCYSCYVAKECRQELNGVANWTVKTKTGHKPHPLWQVLKQAQDVKNRFGAKFGFSPADKTQIAVPQGGSTSGLVK